MSNLLAIKCLSYQEASSILKDKWSSTPGLITFALKYGLSVQIKASLVLADVNHHVRDHISTGRPHQTTTGTGAQLRVERI